MADDRPRRRTRAAAAGAGDAAAPGEDRHLHLHLTGPPALRVTGAAAARPLDRIAAALLAWLAIEGPTPRDRLVALIWPGSRATEPGANLRQWRKRLSLLAGRPVLAGSDLVALAPGVVHDLAVAPDGSDPPAGELLAGQAYDDEPELAAWLESQRSRRRALSRVRQQQALDALAQQGRWDDAIVLAETMLLDDRHAEHAYLRVARLYWKRGDRAGARAVVARCRAALATDQVFQLGPEMAELATLLAHHGSPAAPPELPLAPARLLAPPRMVGREAEWRALHAAWRAGRAVWLEGEEGVGNTRFIEAVVAAHPGAVCVPVAPGDQALPDELLRRVLRNAAAAVLAGGPAALRGELARWLPELGAPVPRPPYRPRLAETVTETLRLAHEAGLAALALDDLQWADSGSLELLLTAADRLGPAGPSWLFGCRHGARPGAAERWAPLAEGRAVELRLGSLSREATVELLGTLGWPPGRALAWAHALHARTLGHPRAVLETLAALHQRDGDAALQGDPPCGQDWPAPEALVQGAQARLLRLGAASQALARLAALAGSGFSVALAEQVLSEDTQTLRTAWQALEQAQWFRDGHLAGPWLETAVRAELPEAFVHDLHGRIADAGTRLGWPAARVAHHAWLAGRHAQAGAAFERAAAEARASNDRHGEAALLHRAADCHDVQGRGDAAFAARAAATEAALPVAPHEATGRSLVELRRHARSAAQSLRAATLQVQWAAAGLHRDPLRALATEVESLLADPRLEADDTLRLQGWSAAAVAHGLAGDFDAALRALGITAPLADAAPAPDEAWRLQLAGARSHVLHAVGRLDEAEAAMREAFALAERADDWAEAMTHAANMVVVMARRGDVEQAWRWSAVAARLRRRLGADRGVAAAQARMNHGMAALRTGRYAIALGEFQGALESLGLDAPLNWRVVGETHLAQLWLELGQPARARAALQTAATPATGGLLMRRGVEAMLSCEDDTSWGVALRPALAEPVPESPAIRGLWELAWAATLPPAEALAVCRRVEQDGVQRQLPALASHARLRLAHAAARAGEHALASQALTAVLDRLQTCRPMNLSQPQVWWLAAQVHQAAGRRAAAHEACCTGVAWIDSVGLPNVPAPWRDSFLNGNPVHAALRAGAGSDPPPAG